MAEQSTLLSVTWQVELLGRDQESCSTDQYNSLEAVRYVGGGGLAFACTRRSRSRSRKSEGQGQIDERRSSIQRGADMQGNSRAITLSFAFGAGGAISAGSRPVIVLCTADRSVWVGLVRRVGIALRTNSLPIEPHAGSRGGIIDRLLCELLGPKLICDARGPSAFSEGGNFGGGCLSDRNADDWMKKR